jgi:subtilisin family serine protease
VDGQGTGLSIATSGATWGHSSATNAFSVAAINVNSAYPNAYTGGSANPFEPTFSDGLRHVFYNSDGSAMTPGNFSSTGGSIRQKPDIAAADDVSTDVPGFQPFSGTSAAAPHAAAIAALLWSYSPSLTPAQIRTVLTGTALDEDPVGLDRDTGYGIVMAYQALNVVSLSPASGNVWVDFNYTGSPNSGTYANPYKTMAQATNGVASGGTVWIRTPGSTSATMTISKSLTLRAYEGPGTIGN